MTNQDITINGMSIAVRFFGDTGLPCIQARAGDLAFGSWYMTDDRLDEWNSMTADEQTWTVAAGIAETINRAANESATVTADDIAYVHNRYMRQPL